MSIYDDPTYAEFLKSYAPEKPKPTKAPERTWGEAVKDVGISLGTGTAGLVKGVVSTLGGNDNEVYDFADTASKSLEQGLSERSKYKSRELSQKLEQGGIIDAAKYALTNPDLMANMIAESLPAMAAGGGVGGILARGAAGLTAAGTIGRVGTAIASGIGEGTFMATDVYDKTGSGIAALEALALGTVTGGLTPGNVVAGITRKGLGEAAATGVETLSTLQRKGAGYAAGRVGSAIGQEAAQEFVQEGGQALIEQGAGEGPLDFRKAAAQGALGAALGGVMGGGMHPVVGEGSKAAELANAEAVLAKTPDNPVAQAEVALLRAQRDYVEAAPADRPGLKQAVEVAQAAVTAARMPNSRAAQENLDTARAEAVINNAGMEGARVGADAVSAETTQAIREAGTADEAITAFADGQQAHTTLTVDAQAVQNTRAGARQGVADALAAEIERVKSGGQVKAADVTANPELFPIEEVPATPKVSDKIGLTRNTPIEVARETMQQSGATDFPTIDASRLGESVKQAAIANTALPSVVAPAGWTVVENTPNNFDIVDPQGVVQYNSANRQRAEGIAAQENAAIAPAVTNPRQAYIDMLVANGDTQLEAETTASHFSRRSSGDLQAAAGDPKLSNATRAYARHLLQQTGVIPSPTGQALADARQAWITQTGGTQREAEAFEAADRTELEARAASTRRPAAAAFAQAILAHHAAGGSTRKRSTPEGSPAVVAAVQRMRERERANGISPSNTEATIRDARTHVASMSLPEINSEIDSLEDNNNHTEAALWRALRDERAQQDEQVEAVISREQVEQLRDERLVTTRGTVIQTHSTLDSIIAHAPQEVADALTRLSQWRALIDERVAPFDEATQTILEWGLSDEGLASGVNPMDMQHLVEARVILGLVEDKGEEGLSQADMDEINSELVAETAPMEINEKIAEFDRLAEDENMPDEQRADARQQARDLRAQRDASIRSGQVSQHTTNPTPRTSRSRAPVTRAGVRSVQSSFDTRATKASRDGTLLKLGKFFKTLMGPRNTGQRVLPKINTSDLKTQARDSFQAGRGVPQDVLNEVRNRYNAKLREMAEQWATEKGVPLGRWIDPIRGITARGIGNGAGFSMELYGLGRGGNENPYAVRPNSAYTYFSADWGLHAVDLRDAPGSADLAYRFAAEIADLRGLGFPADISLTTVNPLRRQLQSLSSDTLYGPGRIDPLTSGGTAGMQGVTPAVWNSSSDVEKIGLNALRSAHSITENRPNSATGGNWLENLVFDQQGRIVAYTDPKTSFGFPRGTVVSNDDLKAKIATENPATGHTSFAMRSDGTGGIGPDTAKLGILINTILNHIEDKPGATIPRWIGRVARETGRDIGGWFFSEAEQATAEPGITTAEAEGMLRETVGDTAAKVLLDTGLVRFVETPAELADLGGVPLTSVSGAVQGATLPDGTIVLVTGNLAGETAAAVLQHEALHATLKALVGEDTYNRLMSRLETMLQAGEGAQWVQDAKAAVPANTPAENVTEEVAAYAVEQYVKNPESDNPLVRWARDFMSALRSAIIQNKALPEALRVWAIQNVQPQDFARMAIAGLKAQANAAGTMRESRRNYDAEIAALMEEHKGATNERRAEINAELATLNKFRNAEADVAFEKGTTDEPSNIRGEAAGVPAQAEYGTPREGAVSVDATHFSNAQRNQLNTTAYGTGAKGEEAGRLSAPENADIRDRTHFYVNEGSGIRPEAGVGGVAHNVKLNNLYDIKADPLGYRAFNRNDVNAMERAIVNAGFDGYYAPNYANGQGVAVVIGKHSIPVSPGEGGTNVVAQFQGDTYAANLAKSKLPGGQMSGREWLIAINGTEFDTPSVRAELQAREGQTLYRDDLPRFNKPSNGNIRFSIAQETERAVEPVASPPAPMQEFTVRGPNGRTAMERIYEMVRKALQDKHVTLRRIQQLAGVTAEQLKMDTMGALDRLGSKMSSTHKQLVKEPLAAIENILYKSYNDGDAAHSEMNTLLTMLHVPEYNRRISTVNPAKYDETGKRISGFDENHPGSGIKTAEAETRSAELLRGPHGEALSEAVKVYREMIENLQDYAVAQGLEKQEVIDAWRDPETGFSNYTPFHRNLDLEENLGIGTARGAKGFSLRTGITQRAMGSSAEIFDPLAATLILGTRIVSRGENAVVARTMLEFAKGVVPNFVTRNGDKKPMWSVDIPPTTRVIKRTNIYKTLNADGTMSPEFYNREQARLYADQQQAEWVRQNPGADRNTSGIIARLVDTADRVFIQAVPNALNQPNVMVVPVDGENHIITFNEQSPDAMAIMSALKGTGTFGGGKAAKTLNKFLTPFRMFSRWTVALATGFNPMFIPFNAARDIQAAMINAKDGGIPGWTWADSRKVASQFMPAALDINRRLYQEFETLHSNTGAAPEATRGSWGWWMDQAERAGGMTGIMEHIVEPEEARAMIRRLYGAEVERRAMGAEEANDWLSRAESGMLKIGDTFYRFGQGETRGNKIGATLSKQVAARIGRYNSAAEAATRTIVFKEAFEKYMQQPGMTESEAMQLAANISKNISTNFNRRGDISTFLNQLFPFFNAAVQGSARLAEAVFEKHPVAINRETGDKVKVGFTNDANGNRVAVNAETKALLDMSKVSFDQETTYLTPFGKQVMRSLASVGVLQATLLLAAGFDDDEPPQSVKDRAFIVPLGNKNYMAIPMPHGFNTLINFGREMTNATLAGMEGKAKKAFDHIINATAGQASAFNPLGGQGNLWLGVSPALTDPAIALYMNKDVFGRQIAREDMNPRDLTPGFTRTKEGAGSVSRWIAEALNTISGGNEDQPGFISPTGDQVGYLFGELGGGVAREGAKLINAGVQVGRAVAGVPQEEMPVSKMPLIGRIFGTTSDAQGLRSRAFEISKELNSLDNRYKGLKERGDKEGAAAFKAEHPELSLADDFNRFYRADSGAKKRRALARDKGEIEAVNRIVETQTEKAKRLLEKYDSLMQ